MIIMASYKEKLKELIEHIEDNSMDFVVYSNALEMAIELKLWNEKELKRKAEYFNERTDNIGYTAFRFNVDTLECYNP